MAIEAGTLIAIYGIILLLVLWGAKQILEFGDRRAQNTVNPYVWMRLILGSVALVSGVYLFYAIGF